jgi:hypothetical protein
MGRPILVLYKLTIRNEEIYKRLILKNDGQTGKDQGTNQAV